MKRILDGKFLFLVGLLAAGWVMIGAASGSAATLILPLNLIFSGLTPPCSSPWGTATFTDVGSNKVELTLQANLSSCGGAFISKWYFNLDPALNPSSLSFSFVSKSGTFTNPSISTGVNAFKADGDGKFDIRFEFATKSGNRFDNTDSIKYSITGPSGFDALDFNFVSVPAGGEGTFRTAAHIQGFGDSGWAGDGPDVRRVPEPGTLALMGTAVAGALTVRVRRYRRTR
jgi:hypothetical protein